MSVQIVHKKQVEHFLNALNTLLRNEKMYIDFTSGNLYYKYSQYIGTLDDDKFATSIIDEDTGETIYESESIL